MDLLSISKCPARAFNRSNTEEISTTIYRMFGCINDLKNNLQGCLETTKKHPKNTHPFCTSFTKNVWNISRVQKWICYQSLNVQQEPLTDRSKYSTENHPQNTYPFFTSFTKKTKSGSYLDLYTEENLNNNLKHNPKNILFALHLQKK